MKTLNSVNLSRLFFAVLLAASGCSLSGKITTANEESSSTSTTPAPVKKTLQFAWLSGSTVGLQNPSHGVKGVAAASNTPGARDTGPCTVIDSNGNFWLFGGRGADSVGTYSQLNDLWKYDPTTSQWTWISGSNLANQNGSYGIKGTAAAGNYPGARAGMGCDIDSNNNIWVFGGVGYPAAGASGRLSDLWKFDTSTQMWTWMAGLNTRNNNGNYGVRLTPNAANYPGSRNYITLKVDKNNNLWLFGGYGYAAAGGQNTLNDLWRFNTTTSEWTWISGANVLDTWGVYGTQGVPNAANTPGARGGTEQIWVDSSLNVWIFGGSGFDEASGVTGFLNDFWKYDPALDQWTWMSGSKVRNTVAVFGTQGVAHSSNTPGSLTQAYTWIDSDGNLRLYGGNGFDTSASGYLDDFWKFDVSLGQWVWMFGSKTAGTASTFGTLGEITTGVTPGGRFNPSVGFHRTNNQIWIYGGNGIDSNSASLRMSDLWSFNLEK